MPPIDLGDFYSGQDLVQTIWNEKYASDSSFINKLSQTGEAKVENIDATPNFTAAQKATLKTVPKPEEKYRSVMVDRPFNDVYPADSEGVLILDTRMKANTDGDLARWRFVATNGDDASRAAPVVFEEVDGDGSKIQYRIVHMGTPRTMGDANAWQAIAQSNFALKQGQFLGLYLFSEGGESSSSKGMIPYTEDNYLKVTGSDGTTQYPTGVVTHRSFPKETPKLNETITFSDTNYVTYSFEMQNDL